MHFPINISAIFGEKALSAGALVCEGQKPAYIAIDFRFALQCWLKREEFGAQKLAIVLCHELAHIVSRDHSPMHQAIFEFYVLSVIPQAAGINVGR